MVDVGEDPFYRYAVDAPVLRYQGRNQATVTVVENLEEIARQLNRPLPLLLTFLAAAFHTRKGGEGEKAVRGRYTQEEVANVINSFRDVLVCCRACGNPETTYRIRVGKGYMTLICSACGGKSRVKDEDLPPRVWRFLCRIARVAEKKHKAEEG